MTIRVHLRKLKHGWVNKDNSKILFNYVESVTNVSNFVCIVSIAIYYEIIFFIKLGKFNMLPIRFPVYSYVKQ